MEPSLIRRWLMSAGLSRWSTGTNAEVPLWLKFILSSAAVVNGSSVKPYRSEACVWYSYDWRRRRRMKNASPTSAMPATTPMTIPAMAPPEMPPDFLSFSSSVSAPAVAEAELCASEDADVMLVPDVRVGDVVVGEPVVWEVESDDVLPVVESVELDESDEDVDVVVVDGGWVDDVDDGVLDEVSSEELDEGCSVEDDDDDDEVAAALDEAEDGVVAVLWAFWVEYELTTGEPSWLVAW